MEHNFKEIQEMDSEELIETYQEHIRVIRYGEPDAVTAREKRHFELLKAELIDRIGQEVLLEDADN